MRVVIADDEPLALDLLRLYLQEMGGLTIMGEALDGERLVDLVKAGRTDLVICDIDMPRLDGLQAVLAISSLVDVQPPHVIFTTAHAKHALTAFDLGATDYVMKPIDRLRLRQAVKRVRDQRASADPSSPAEEGWLWVAVRNGRTRLPLKDILRIQAAGDHVYLHTALKTYLHRTTMRQLEPALATTGLKRVHRSTFIRIDQVRGLARSGKALRLLMHDGGEVQVGQRYRQSVAAWGQGSGGAKA